MTRPTIKVRARVECPKCGGTHTPFVEVDAVEAERALAHVKRVEYRAALDVTNAITASLLAQSKVYVIRNPRTGAVKIGRSLDVAGRLRELRAASGEPLELVAIVGEGSLLERALHLRFASARRQGEWFDSADPELAMWLVSLVPLAPEIEQQFVAPGVA